VYSVEEEEEDIRVSASKRERELVDMDGRVTVNIVEVSCYYVEALRSFCTAPALGRAAGFFEVEHCVDSYDSFRLS
jgi:uncharacterized protein (UPF0305 family)